MKRLILADVRNGSVVYVGNRWGVLSLGSRRHSYRIVDFWDGGREWVRSTAPVDVQEAA